jgi:hypothetical protein
MGVRGWQDVNGRIEKRSNNVNDHVILLIFMLYIGINCPFSVLLSVVLDRSAKYVFTIDPTSFATQK